MARAGTSCLRVAFVAGSLTQGGAEKQLLYGVRALRDLGADVRVYSLTRGEHYEPALADAGAAPLWVGRHGLPAVRVMTLARRLRQFEPHIVQSTHFFANLYAALGSRGRRRVGVGALRNDTTFEVDANGRWGKWLLRLPPVLIANSFAARRNAAALGRPPDRIFVVPNAIDLAAFDRGARQPEGPDLHGEGSIVAMTVAQIDPVVATLGDRVPVLAISQDMDPAKAVAFLDQRRFTHLRPYLDAKLGLSLAYGTNLPTTILYGADGKEIWRVTGDLDWTGAQAKGLLAEAA